MILKGNQRSNGADLAVHLMNEFDNERVLLTELRGTIATDLKGAFAEFEAIASGTKCTQPLYSLSINPSQPMSPAQYEEAITAIEDKLGLTGQPRVIVFHEKYGREHAHVVWSRIRVDNMRAIAMSHDHRKLCDLACDLAHRFGHELPPGLKAWEKRERFEKQKFEPTLGERAQALKTGLTPDERRAEITALYDRADSGPAFQAALAQAGYVLAKGDRRGYVLVDQEGEVHSLSRYIAGHSAKEIRAKLAALSTEQLPDVDEAKLLIDRHAQSEFERQREQDLQRLQAQRDAAAASLNRTHTERRTKMAGVEQTLLTRQAAEKMSLHAAQLGEGKGLAFRVRSAVADLIARTPGLRSVLGPIQKRTNLDPREKQTLEWKALAQRHERERLDLEREKALLTQVEVREQLSLARWATRTAVHGRRLGDQLKADFTNAAGRPQAGTKGANGENGDGYANQLHGGSEAGTASSFGAGDLSAQFNNTADEKHSDGGGSQASQASEGHTPEEAGHDIHYDEALAKSWKDRSQSLKANDPSHDQGYGLRRDAGNPTKPDSK